MGTAPASAAAPPRVSAAHSHARLQRAPGSHGHGTCKVKTNSFPDSRSGRFLPASILQIDMELFSALLFGRAIHQAGVPGNPGWEPLLEGNIITSSKCVWTKSRCSHRRMSLAPREGSADTSIPFTGNGGQALEVKWFVLGPSGSN